MWGDDVRYASLFSGVEAATVAWHPLGWEPVLFAEFDAFPSAVLAHHYPDIPNVGDVTQYDWKQHKGEIDLIVGGSPCQSFSVAGKRLGLDDPRGNLSLEYLRVVRDVQPRWFLYENVPGLLSSGSGRDFAAFIEEVEKLGYGWAYRIVDARFCGVPQRRRRIFFIGCAGGDWNGPGAILFEPESLSRYFEACSSEGESITGTSGDSTEGESGAGSERSDSGSLIDDYHIFSQRDDTAPKGSVSPRDHSPCLKATDSKGPPVVWRMTPTSSGKNWRVREIDESQTITTDPSPTGRLGGDVVMERFPVDVYNGQIYSSDSPTPTMTTGTGVCNASGPKVGERPISLHATQDPITDEDVFPALGTGGSSGSGSLAVAIPNVMAVRKLTPLECERLQGFPDNWTQIPWRNKPAERCPNGHRYKAMGNSMAVPVMGWIGKRLDVVDKLMANGEKK